MDKSKKIANVDILWPNDVTEQVIKDIKLFSFGNEMIQRKWYKAVCSLG